MNDAMGDGLDINSSFQMTRGVVIVNDPTNDGNGPVDYLGTFDITGGFLVAVGSSGMAQTASTSSAQYSVLVNFPTMLPEGTMIHFKNEDGEEVLTFLPTKAYQSVLLSSPELEKGTIYIVYAGGSSSGTSTNALYSEGSYSGGTQMASFTISSIVTGEGSNWGGFPGGRGPGGQRP